MDYRVLPVAKQYSGKPIQRCADYYVLGNDGMGNCSIMKVKGFDIMPHILDILNIRELDGVLLQTACITGVYYIENEIFILRRGPKMDIWFRNKGTFNNVWSAVVCLDPITLDTGLAKTREMSYQDFVRIISMGGI